MVQVGVMVSWWHSVRVSLSQGVQGVRVLLCHSVRAVSQCHCVRASWCHGVTVSRCHGVTVSWCQGVRVSYSVIVS
jgi:hypothetical protein